MISEKSCGAVIFRKNEEIKYLLLHYGAGHWDFVKGNLEKGEDEKETVVREAREEAGITDLVFVEDFKEKIQYFYRREKQLVRKEVIFYLAETKTKKVRLSYEHIGYAWLNFEDAVNKLTFKTAKDVLEKANDFLENV